MKAPLGMAALLLVAAAVLLIAIPAHSSPTIDNHSSSRAEIKVSVRPYYRLQARIASSNDIVKRAANSHAFCFTTNMSGFALPVAIVQVNAAGAIDEAENNAGVCTESYTSLARASKTLGEAVPPYLYLVRPE